MKKISLIIFLLFLGKQSFGQNDISSIKSDSVQPSIIYLNNGKTYIGEIIEDDGREILLNSKSVGKIYVRKSDIKEITTEKSRIIKLEEKALVESPFTTRYAYTNNAFPIKKGYNYAMVNLFGPEIHFATSDRLSLGVMTTWIGSPIAFNFKYSLASKSEKWHYSVGSIIGTSGFILQGSGYGGLTWFTGTYGNRIDNISISAGYGCVGELNSTYFMGGPLFSIAGIKRIGNGISFIFDSMFSIIERSREKYTNIYVDVPYYDSFSNSTYIIPEYQYTKQETINAYNYSFFIMPGLRFQKHSDRAFQVSLAGVINIHKDQTNSFPVPMCSWLFKL